MKALSLTQPWASAIVLGLKFWETRSWPTRFRGEFALHAAKGFPKWAKEFAVEKDMATDVPCFQQRADLRLGAIIAVCELTQCLQTETALEIKAINSLEDSWGDYADGRYAFKLENVRALQEPVYCKGALGFWTVPPEIEKQVRSML